MARQSPLGALTGLALGLAAGGAIASSGSATLRSVVPPLDAIGTVWVNAIRMTVIPLVISLLIATIAREKDLAAVGRLGGRAVLIFTALLAGVAALGFLAAPPLFARLTVDAASATALRNSAAPVAAASKIPGFGAWVVSLIPPNPVAAAVDGSMLPLVIFAVLFAVALARTQDDLRAAGTAFFQGIADAMLVVVGWVLALAPIGVFALGVGVASRLGVAVAGVVGFYLAVHCGLLAVSVLALYVIGPVVGRVPIGRFSRGLLPAQVVAVSTRSSVASLPAMIDGSERVLHLPPEVASFALPFGVSIFRLNQGVSWVVCALFLGKLYGIHLDVVQLALLAATSVPLSYSVPGIPSGGLLVVAPFFSSIGGLPLEGIGILIALDVIPDLFKTLLNVTGQVTATTILARGQYTASP